MIYVGQIYKLDDGSKIVITESSPKRVRGLYSDATPFHSDSPYKFQKAIDDKCVELISQYPSWQQAVNSMDFMEGK